MISATQLRRWHAYIALFIAPSVLFFALTGALQIFNLHKARGSYQPAILLEQLAAVHKDQVFKAPHHRPPAAKPESAPPAASAPHAADHDDKTSWATLASKWFFFAVSLGLIISTLMGIWMGTTQIRRMAVAWTLLIAGTLLPLVLLMI